MLSDKKTIAVINDNDFEIAINATDEDGNKVKITDYIYDASTKELSTEDTVSNLDIELVKNTEESEIWTIELKDEITSSSNEVSAEEEIIEKSSESNNSIVYAGALGAVLVGALLYLLRKKKK